MPFPEEGVDTVGFYVLKLIVCKQRYILFSIKFTSLYSITIFYSFIKAHIP